MEINKRGRPRKGKNAIRTNRFEVRLTHDEEHILDSLTEATEVTKSEVVRKALRVYYDYLFK